MCVCVCSGYHGDGGGCCLPPFFPGRARSDLSAFSPHCVSSLPFPGCSSASVAGEGGSEGEMEGGKEGGRNVGDVRGGRTLIQ